MTTEEKKIIENNFDRMREVIRETKLFINVGDTTVGETYLRDGDVFRIATALINEGFRLERTGEWLTGKYSFDRSVCSVCGATFDGDGGNYCCSCGAKMKVNI
jgi:5'(3')-deoxyribonucleotidase